ncbi:sll0787 family AIR synthase-like protein [Caballeronia sp. DA-9]|uniref:sll0787 family AIR synthase-like protein n=1 Tax=Caballeronia sp. DA-9 TaxID=3436237 RepID=UPI003F67A64B
MNVADLVAALRETRGFRHKTDIAGVMSSLARHGSGLPSAIANGDDCAAIPDGDGYLLFAIEGMVSDFVRDMPWFAGYSSVMVNVSDIYAMGGHPVAVVDALWSDGLQRAEDVLAGMAAASLAYGVPIVGGHSNTRGDQVQLAVSIIGRARKLLSSFNARPGDRLMMAIDLRGRFEDPYPFWNASVGAPAERLRADLEILSTLAESGLCDAAKDISMAGALGTALMLLECSRVGASIDLSRLPAPAGVERLRWLTAFPSFGFVMSVREENVTRVEQMFKERELACAVIGTVDASRKVSLHDGDDTAQLWNFEDEAFITSGGTT